MEPINELLHVRKEKEEYFRRLGIDPYPQERGDFAGSDDIQRSYGDLTEEEIAKKESIVSFAGRIVAFRDFGKSSLPPRAGQGRKDPGLRAKGHAQIPRLRGIQEARRGRHHRRGRKGLQDEDGGADHPRRSA